MEGAKCTATCSRCRHGARSGPSRRGCRVATTAQPSTFLYSTSRPGFNPLAPASMVAPGGPSVRRQMQKCQKPRGSSPQKPLDLAESRLLSRVGSHGWSLFCKCGPAFGRLLLRCVQHRGERRRGVTLSHPGPPCIADRGEAARLPKPSGEVSVRNADPSSLCGLPDGWINLWFHYGGAPDSQGAKKGRRCLLSACAGDEMGTKGSSTAP